MQESTRNTHSMYTVHGVNENSHPQVSANTVLENRIQATVRNTTYHAVQMTRNITDE